MGLTVRCFLSVLGALCIVPSVWAQFLVPNENAEDLTEKWTVGSTMNIVWHTRAGQNKYDLWVETFRNDAIAERILANVELDGSGSFDWKINLTNVQVSIDPQFRLRFIQQGEDAPVYPYSSPMMESKGFYIFPDGTSSSSSKSTPTPSFPLSSGPATVTETLSSPPASTDASTVSGSVTLAPKEEKLSKAAIAGGVVGGLVVIALFLGGVLFLLRRLKQKKKATEAYGNGQHMNEKDGTTTYAYEMETPPAELPSSSHPVMELQGSSGEPYATPRTTSH